MLKTRLFSCIIAMLFSTFCIAQNKTLLGVEGASTHDVFGIADDLDFISQANLFEESLGFTLSREIHQKFILETGLINKNYVMGYRYSKGSYTGGKYWNDFRAWQIPLRLRSNINLYKNKAYFTAITGFHFCINKEIDKQRTLLEFDDFSSDYYNSATYNAGLVNYFPLLETGAGIEFKLFKSAFLTFSASYFTGFKNTTEIDIIYKGNNNKLYDATAVSKGEYWNVACSLRYPISDFWQ